MNWLTQPTAKSSTRFRGVALPEMLIGIFVLATLTVAIMGLATLGTRTAIVNEQRVVAQAIANEQAEIVRSLPYDLVAYDGTVCNPTVVPDLCDGVDNPNEFQPTGGVLPHQQFINRGGLDYEVLLTITFVDDELNNSRLPTQFNSAVAHIGKLIPAVNAATGTRVTEGNSDYKQVVISVAIPAAGSSQAVTVSSTVFPGGAAGDPSCEDGIEAGACDDDPQFGAMTCCEVFEVLDDPEEPPADPQFECRQSAAVAGCPPGRIPTADGCGCTDIGGDPVAAGDWDEEMNVPDQGEGVVCPNPIVGACNPNIGRQIMTWQNQGGLCVPVPRLVPCGQAGDRPWCDLDDAGNPGSGSTDCGYPDPPGEAADGQYELNPDCQDPGNECNANEKCIHWTDEICDQWECVAGKECCNAEGPLTAFQKEKTCQARVCVDPFTPACNTDADCDLGRICQQKVCRSDGKNSCLDCPNPPVAMDEFGSPMRVSCCYSLDRGVWLDVEEDGDLDIDEGDQPCRRVGQDCALDGDDSAEGTCILNKKRGTVGCDFYSCNAIGAPDLARDDIPVRPKIAGGLDRIITSRSTVVPLMEFGGWYLPSSSGHTTAELFEIDVSAWRPSDTIWHDDFVTACTEARAGTTITITVTDQGAVASAVSASPPAPGFFQGLRSFIRTFLGAEPTSAAAEDLDFRVVLTRDNPNSPVIDDPDNDNLQLRVGSDLPNNMGSPTVPLTYTVTDEDITAGKLLVYVFAVPSEKLLDGALLEGKNFNIKAEVDCDTDPPVIDPSSSPTSSPTSSPPTSIPPSTPPSIPPSVPPSSSP